jgi:hypothetical protein
MTFLALQDGRGPFWTTNSQAACAEADRLNCLPRNRRGEYARPLSAGAPL